MIEPALDVPVFTNSLKYQQLTERLKPCGLGHKVLMGVGPMSKNVVDAVIEMVNVLKFPIQLVASRRQVECEAFGGGYVNNWTTETFANYVRDNDKTGNILLCRDHGGPWQGIDEDKLSAAKAMERACVSCEADIRSGFDVIHLAPCLRDRALAAVKKDVEKLLAFCEGIPGSDQVVYECGSGEMTSDTKDFEELVAFCTALSPKIKFIVGQTGTLVRENTNIGQYDNAKARELVAICNRHGVLLKEHNLDYATDLVLKDHRPAGIHSVNLGPEFGTAETTILLELLYKHKMKKEAKRIAELANKSGKWKKWVVSEVDDLAKALIAGHYVYSNPEVQEIKARLNEKMYLDDVLKVHLSCLLIKYLKEFRWLV